MANSEIEILTGFILFVPMLVGLLSIPISKLSKKLTILANVLVTFIASLSIIVLLIENKVFQLSYSFLDIPLVFRFDSISLFVAFIPMFLGFLTMVYSYSYQESNISIYYSGSLIFIASMVNLVLSENLVWMYIFMEIATISSAILVSLGKRTEAKEAALKYMIISLFTSAATIIGIFIIKNTAGTLLISQIEWNIILTNENMLNIKLAIILIFVGLGTKAAAFPFYFWLPDAHSEAPATVSVLLSGGKIKIALFSLFLILYKLIGSLSTNLTTESFLTVSVVLAWIGVLTMVIGNIMALAQNDIKRMLAYCSISQIGYIMIGFSLGTTIGITAALFHMLTHSAAKGLLFFGAGSVEHATKTRDIDALGAVAAKMPITTLAMVIGSLSISGIPPFGGYTSKRILYEAFFDAGHSDYAIIAILVSALTLVLFLKLLSSVFFGIKPNMDVNTIDEVSESPKTMTFPMIILAIGCLIFGVIPDYIINSFIRPSISIFLPNEVLPPLETWPNILIHDATSGSYSPVPTTILIILGLVIGALLYYISTRGKLKEIKPIKDDDVTKVSSSRLPFTGGFYKAPYISLGQIYVSSAPFEYAAGPILEFFKKFHTGRITSYLWYITFGFLIISGFVLILL